MYTQFDIQIVQYWPMYTFKKAQYTLLVYKSVAQF